MRLSTLVELGGFGLIAYGAYRLDVAAGLIVGGALCLLIGYATEDRAGVVAVERMVAPLLRRRAAWRTRRANRRRHRRDARRNRASWLTVNVKSE